ncbi:hypothetical protein BPTFM16_01833 [Altererythrobacter insulae]|nr:hypothetical protein BPTFM16_01833 [Altererythrobacter insulae]
MRMQLFAVEFVREDGIFTGHIVAPSITFATDFAAEYHDDIDTEVIQTSIFRVDESLPEEYRAGLDDLLLNAPIGFASRSTQFGWFVHTVLQPRQKLLTIEVENEEDVYVIAPSADIASVIWLWSLDLGQGGTHPRWKIFSGLEHLDQRQIAGLDLLLDPSAAGVVTWDEKVGWIVD